MILSPGRRQATIWSNTGILLIGRMGMNFTEILIEIYTFSFQKMYFKISSAKWRPFRLGSYELGHDMRSTRFAVQYEAGLILGLGQTNERRRYFVATSLIGWAQT